AFVMLFSVVLFVSSPFFLCCTGSDLHDALAVLLMPVVLLPDIIQKLALLLPQYYAHQALQDALNGTLTYKAFFQGLFTILAYGCAGFILGVIRYPHFLKQARG